MTQDEKEAALNCVYAYETSDVYKALQDALTELEAHKAIAASFVKAEQEPVAWGYFDADGSFMDALDRQHGAYQTPLYAAPVRTKDLTITEMNVAYDKATKETDGRDAHTEGLRAVIAADREKNK